jgi:hypothetical protein
MSWRRTFRQVQVQSTPANIDKPLGFDPQRQRTAPSMRSPDLQVYASGPHREGASSSQKNLKLKNL